MGYKLHLDVADGQVPISMLVTSASRHDSQAAIALATMSARKVTSCYDLMDAAYDCAEIKQHSLSLGHIPIIDTNPRRNTELKIELAEEDKRQKFIHFTDPEKQRYNERSTAERAFGRLKDEFGAASVYVKGYAKVACHLGLSVLVLTVDQLMRFVT